MTDAPGSGTPPERFCTVGHVRLCYQEFGDATHPCVLLIMGLGMQLIAWDDDFCKALADRGFRVVRFDNRDCGRSTHLDHLGRPPLWRLLTRRRSRRSYTLADMAPDAVGLLDHLRVEAAHVVGVSLGAMIAQSMAVNSPPRVLSLASIMGSTGALTDGQPSLRLWPHLLRRVPGSRTSFVARLLSLLRRTGSPHYPQDEAKLSDLLGRTFDRGANSDGVARQLLAALSGPSRRQELRRVTAPTVVIHGTADRLVAPSGGRATSEAIPGSRLLLIPGMGHDLPTPLWPRLIDEITTNARRDAIPTRTQQGA